ncbi:MAG: thiamine pyrophosphate-dependent dehydrogenase E1 component subunit alpha [Chloroflexota bacterium]|nr:thiamine pyrophosphate-dependent dehydrogenase E1 component subunit alpha [Chloroflexota bacterium]MDE3192424.1 thiamine pyrophosphate-dependent dehydrogenase E1 component subunit alpha [Chloroflexota bacterium]
MAVRTKTSPQATRPRHEALGLTLDDVTGMYRKMLECRMIGERMMQLNRMGRAAFVGVADGHEAAEVGSAWCIRKGTDWVHPYYRDVGVALVLGQDARDQFLGVFAKATDPNSAGRQIVNQFSDPDAKIVTGSVCIATQFPQAAGIGLALKMRHEDAIVFTYGGDGATSPGDFHEAVNFAAIHDLPVVFIIENNLYSISTPNALQMSAAPHERAKGYGIPGLLADGMDVLDVYEKTKEAVERARRGEGPSIVETRCYRYRPHSSDDDDSRYRSKDEVTEWLARDPVARGRAYLLEQGVAEAELDAMRAEIAADIERAIDAAEAEPDPRPEDLLRHVYAEGHALPDGTRA